TLPAMMPSSVVAPGYRVGTRERCAVPGSDRFDPDRMLGATLSPTTWLPFGGGNRRCLGAGFAMVEMGVVLREILRRVDLNTTTAAGERPKLKHVIYIPHRGAQIRVKTIRDVGTASRAATQASAR